jgi:hypothetical protein
LRLQCIVNLEFFLVPKVDLLESSIQYSPMSNTMGPE